MKPELESGISNRPDASFKAFRLQQPAFRSHWHYHPELELVFFNRGQGARFIGDDISLYREGNLFLIGKNLPHTFVSYQNDATPLADALCIQFAAHLFDAFAECAPLRLLFDQASRGVAVATPTTAVVDKLHTIVAATGLPALLALIDVLDAISQTTDRQFITAETQLPHTPQTDATTRVQTAVDYINTHYQRPISLREIADVCHLSPNAFCRWFRRQLGLTFVDYLNKVRLTYVCQLLLSTDQAIGHIAGQTGFDNISTLNRLFRQKLTLSPGQYRGRYSRSRLPEPGSCRSDNSLCGHSTWTDLKLSDK